MQELLPGGKLHEDDGDALRRLTGLGEVRVRALEVSPEQPRHGVVVDRHDVASARRGRESDASTATLL